MLFNSYEFILLFLPLTLAVFYLLARYSLFTYAKLSLTIASLGFYAYWDYRYLALLLSSILFNYYYAKAFLRCRQKLVIALGVAVNLGLLGYYKYADFFLNNVNSLFGSSYGLLSLVLPLGISFFTFQQIAFLVDSYREPAKAYGFLDYMLFVTFFPQLIAGPIVSHREMIPQLKESLTYLVNYRNLVLGVMFFSIGLFKKVIIADTLAGWATPGFDVAKTLTFFEAWGTALSYTFQLYYDFSGYAEMAIGLGLLFNIKLPINFLSPYKADSIIDFWRRWHITLSDFLKNYLYIALGGNRKGKYRRHANLFLTMLLGGLWHGAGWTFVLWGCMHGLYLVINHSFREGVKALKGSSFGGAYLETAAAKEKAPLATKAISSSSPLTLNASYLITKLPAKLLTFLAVVVAWVFFRAQSFEDAYKVLKGMAGLSGFALGESKYLPGGGWELLALALLYAWVNLAPNTIEISQRFKPNWFWAAVLIVIAFLAILSMNKVSEFLYFQF